VNIPQPTPVKVVVPASPCGTVAPARKYDAQESALVQVASSKTEASAVPTWAFPFFGVLAMFSFSAFVAVRARRGTTVTRVVQAVEPAGFEPLMLSDDDDLA